MEPTSAGEDLARLSTGFAVAGGEPATVGEEAARTGEESATGNEEPAAPGEPMRLPLYVAG